MAAARVLILRAPGTNCDLETEHAFELAGASVERLHVFRVVESPDILRRFQILCIPGGFSYGDDLGAGRIFASLLRHRLREQILEFRDRGGLILGICNGFQVLLQTGLLLESGQDGPRATLAPNAHGRFEDRWIHLKMNPGPCAFVRKEEILAMPIAHGEGNFTVGEPSVLAALESADRITARYVDAQGRPGPFPINPNGSAGDVAGICDATGRVFALMPHPERHVRPSQHPRWTRRKIQPDEGDGLVLFRNAVEYFS